VRLLHLADLHLGWKPEFLGELAAQRAGERDSLLERAVNFALDKRHEISAVLIAGDLFEAHRPPRAVLEPALRQLQRLVRGGVFLLTVPGNHDEITYHDSVYRAEAGRWPGVLVQRPSLGEVARLERDGQVYAFYSLAYHAGLTKTSPPLAEFPRGRADFHVGALHGTIDRGTGDRSLPISGDAIAASGYDCLALGHLHSYSARYLGGTLAVYAGACEAKTFSDPGTGCFTVISLPKPGDVVSYPAHCRPCLTKEVELNYCDNEADVISAVQRLADNQALLRVIFKGQATFNVDIDKIQAQCSSLFYHLELKSESLYVDFEKLRRLSGEPTILGLFVKNLLKRLEEAANEDEREIVRRALLRGEGTLSGGIR
jgi:DNA repair exonuclease SbcCD nuclease subunit